MNPTTGPKSSAGAEQHATELNATKLNATKLNAAEPNAAELNAAELNATEQIVAEQTAVVNALDSGTARANAQENPLKPREIKKESAEELKMSTNRLVDNLNMA